MPTEPDRPLDDGGDQGVKGRDTPIDGLPRMQRERVLMAVLSPAEDEVVCVDTTSREGGGEDERSSASAD